MDPHNEGHVEDLNESDKILIRDLVMNEYCKTKYDQSLEDPINNQNFKMDRCNYQNMVINERPENELTLGVDTGVSESFELTDTLRQSIIKKSVCKFLQQKCGVDSGFHIFDNLPVVASEEIQQKDLISQDTSVSEEVRTTTDSSSSEVITEGFPIGLSAQEEADIEEIINRAERANSITEELPGYAKDNKYGANEKKERMAMNDEDNDSSLERVKPNWPMATHSPEVTAQAVSDDDTKHLYKELLRNGKERHVCERLSTSCVKNEESGPHFVRDGELEAMDYDTEHTSAEDLNESVNRRGRGHLKACKASCPVNEERGPFSIPDKQIVTMYQEGLAHGHWNPTQVLYEICSQCNWLPPLFVQLKYSKNQGFHFAVIVKDVQFVPEERGPTKKIATHLASTHFLKFLGFKFELPLKKSAEGACNYSIYSKKEYNYQNQHERKLLRERIRKPISGESNPTSDRSEGTSRLKSCRYSQTRSPTSASRHSGEESPPCKRYRQRLYRNNEPDSNTRRHSQSRSRTSSSCRSSKKSRPWMSSRLRMDGYDEPRCSSSSSSQTGNPVNSTDDFPHWKKGCQRLDDLNPTNRSRGRPSQSRVTKSDSGRSILHRKSFRSNDTEQYHKTVCTRREHDSLSHHSSSLSEKRYNYPNNMNVHNKKCKVPDHVRKAWLDAQLDSIRSEMFS